MMGPVGNLLGMTAQAALERVTELGRYRMLYLQRSGDVLMGRIEISRAKSLPCLPPQRSGGPITDAPI